MKRTMDTQAFIWLWRGATLLIMLLIYAYLAINIFSHIRFITDMPMLKILEVAMAVLILLPLVATLGWVFSRAVEKSILNLDE